MWKKRRGARTVTTSVVPDVCSNESYRASNGSAGTSIADFTEYVILGPQEKLKDASIVRYGELAPLLTNLIYENLPIATIKKEQEII
jgi:hypothetical protein